MLYLQRTGKFQYQILESIIALDGTPAIVVRDHFNDDRGMASTKLIDACEENMGHSGRNDMIAECTPLIGSAF